MKNVYVFGNEWLKDDSLAKEVAQGIKQEKFHLKWCTSPDDLLDATEDLIILDVVKNIKKPMVIHNIHQLKTRKLMSLHDYDVGFFLTLMQKLGKIKKVMIIGLPEKGNKEVLRNEVIRLISARGG